MVSIMPDYFNRRMGNVQGIGFIRNEDCMLDNEERNGLVKVYRARWDDCRENDETDLCQEDTRMSHTIHYSGDRKDKLAKALKDAKEYVGEARWERILILVAMILADENMRPRKKAKNCRFSLSFAGVQGLPATAIIKHVIGILKGK